MLAFQERLTVYCGATPVPLADSVLFVLVDVVYVSVAEEEPLLVGANETVNATLCPELRVNGKEAPEMAYCELLLEAEFTVTDPPDAVMVDVWFAELPTSTLPKLSDAGEAES